MNEIQQVTQAVFADTPLRTGYSEEAQASYVVAADIKGAMNYGGSTNMFLQGLESQQETAGQAKGGNNDSPLYVGTEVIETAGGPQKMKVVYKRGVFQLLMLSRKEEATAYRDKVFNVLEQIERQGYYVQANATEQQLESLKEDLKLHELSEEIFDVKLADAKAKAWKLGLEAGRYSSKFDRKISNPYSDEVLKLLPKYVEEDEEWALELHEELN